MSVFSGTGEATVSKSGSYFKPGKYNIKIKACKLVDSQSGKVRTYFIVETEVLESDNPEIPVGNERSYVIAMDNIMAKPNIKAFVSAVSGVDPLSEQAQQEVEKYWQKELLRRELTEGEHVPFDDICELVVDEQIQLFKGIEMRLECEIIKTREKGEDFTKHNWQPRAV
jgi:hypothetical protein